MGVTETGKRLLQGVRKNLYGVSAKEFGQKLEKKNSGASLLAPFYSGYKVYLSTTGNRLSPIIAIDLPIN